MRDATILENNIVQTAGSAGESIAFGLGVTMPAIMILGFDLEVTRVMLVATLGGLLGILMMIPLRRALIVDQHGLLKYPEGHRLRRGAEGSGFARRHRAAHSRGRPEERQPAAARSIFTGFGIGFIYQAAMMALQWLEEHPGEVFGAAVQGGLHFRDDRTGIARRRLYHRAAHRVDHVRGRRARLSGPDSGDQIFRRKRDRIVAPGTMPISEMSPDDIRGAYVLYIGAGAVAAGGIISLVRSLPTIWHGIQRRAARSARQQGTRRGRRRAPIRISR